MSIDYIAPNPTNNPVLKDKVFKDSPLSLDMAVAKRKRDTARDPNTLVFSVQNLQELGGLLSSLGSLRVGRPGQKLPTLVSQGYVDSTSGVAQGNFQAALNHQPKIEVIAALGNGNHVIVVLDNNGAAYIDPTGAPPPQEMEGLYQYWPQFYQKPGDDQAKNQLARENVHLHKDIKQQDKTHDSLDWCLTNLQTLSGNIHADAARLKAGRKPDRNRLVTEINGQKIPSDPNNHFALNYVDESINERQKQARRQQLERAGQLHKQEHTNAVQLWRTTSEKNQLATLRADPTRAWVEVYISPPPEYTGSDDLNKYKATHVNGVENEFELKENNDIVAKSTKGKASYKERFTRLAEDMAIAMHQDGSDLPAPITINMIKPPREQTTCVEAFEKIFGRGNVIVRLDGTDDVQDNSFGARPPRY